MTKNKLFSLSLKILPVLPLLISPNVSADCDVQSCGNKVPSDMNLQMGSGSKTSSNTHELILGILIGIGVTLLVLVCINSLTRIRKKRSKL
jgi:hypothetical protein